MPSVTDLVLASLNTDFSINGMSALEITAARRRVAGRRHQPGNHARPIPLPVKSSHLGRTNEEEIKLSGNAETTDRAGRGQSHLPVTIAAMPTTPPGDVNCHTDNCNREIKSLWHSNTNSNRSRKSLLNINPSMSSATALGCWTPMASSSQSKLDEFRQNNITLTNQLKRFEGIDPDAVRQLAEDKRKLEEAHNSRPAKWTRSSRRG